MTAPSRSESAWTRTFYPREGDGVMFDRVVFFTDAVYAIALTLVAVEVGLPEIHGDPLSPADLWDAVQELGPSITAFVVAFIWIAAYWRANHRFVMTLRGMNSRYVTATLMYLGLVAFLPVAAGTLGEYWANPLAVALFAAYAAAVSCMEVVLFLIADRDGLFVAPLPPRFRRFQLIGSFSPVVGFVVSIPVAFVNTLLAMVLWLAVGMVIGAYIQRAHVDPPLDPAPLAD